MTAFTPGIQGDMCLWERAGAGFFSVCVMDLSSPTPTIHHHDKIHHPIHAHSITIPLVVCTLVRRGQRLFISSARRLLILTYHESADDCVL